MEYYSAIEKNEVMPFAATWMDLEIVIPSEVSQKEKDKCISLTCGIYKNDTNEHIHETETDSHREQTCGCQRGGWVWEGWTGSLGLANAN